MSATNAERMLLMIELKQENLKNLQTVLDLCEQQKAALTADDVDGFVDLVETRQKVVDELVGNREQIDVLADSIEKDRALSDDFSLSEKVSSVLFRLDDRIDAVVLEIIKMEETNAAQAIENMHGYQESLRKAREQLKGFNAYVGNDVNISGFNVDVES